MFEQPDKRTRAYNVIDIKLLTTNITTMEAYDLENIFLNYCEKKNKKYRYRFVIPRMSKLFERLSRNLKFYSKNQTSNAYKISNI